ncbi:MAG: hypothetical protein Q8Q09_28125 [Deltaproteobacteria bacterium]|nr:hypothetical protein [Deltaproteobacteria bacterium]
MSIDHPAPSERFDVSVQKALTVATPLRMMAARGMAPMPPATLVSVIYLSQYDSNPNLASAAKATFAALATPILDGALANEDLNAAVLDALATAYKGNDTILQRIVRHKATDASTVTAIATHANDALCEFIAVDEQRLIANKAVIEALYYNEHLRMSTADRLCELAARHGLSLDIPGFEEIVASLQNQLIFMPGEESPADHIFREAIAEASTIEETEDGDLFERDEDGNAKQMKPEIEKVAKRLQDMTISERIRTAMLGSASQRRVLACSPMRVIAEAAVKSPRMQAEEVMKLAMIPEAHEEVLRGIARRGDWLKSTRIRFYLARNPKCPAAVAIAQLNYVTEFDLKTLVRSRTVPFNVRNVAKQLLDKRTQNRGGG